jgi:photosystem II stability/assembly factor-like uncharacterized protein
MLRAVVVVVTVVACHPTPTPTPPLIATRYVAAGDWQVSPTETYKGKQDDIYFTSPKVGFYGNGAGKIFRTDDGGATWTKLVEKPGTFWRALGFLDDKRGFAGNIGPDAFPGVTDTTMLYRTDDGGTTWTAVELPDTVGARGVCAIDILVRDAVNQGHHLRDEIVHVAGRVGGPASMFASSDGGATWKRLPLPAEVAMILDVKFVDPSVGFVFAGSDPDVSKSHGLIEKTSDGGRTWKKVYESPRAYELMWKGSFPSRQIGYASLQNYTGEVAAETPDAVTVEPARFVVKTDDGGEHWRELPVVSDAKVQEFGIGFVDDDHGWVGVTGGGYETTDGGATWAAVATMPKYANKLRVIHDGTTIRVWTIGGDVRHLDLTPRQR